MNSLYRPLSDRERRACAARRGRRAGRQSLPFFLANARVASSSPSACSTAASWGPTAASAAERMWQVVYSAVKVPFLLFTTFFLSLPSFFVINTLLGLRGDFTRVLTGPALDAGRADDHPVGARTLHGLLVRLAAVVTSLRSSSMASMFAVASFSAPVDAAAQLRCR